MLASTLDSVGQSELPQGITEFSGTTSMRVIGIAGDEHQARVIPIGSGGNSRIVAVLHRSLADALAVFDRLRKTLFVLAALSLLFSIVAASRSRSTSPGR